MLFMDMLFISGKCLCNVLKFRLIPILCVALPECVFVLNHVLELSVQVFIHKIVAGVIKFAATKKIGADMDLPEK